MTAEFRYRHAMITGASSGIGRSFAVLIASKMPKTENSSIFLTGRDLNELKITEEKIRVVNAAVKVFIHAADLSDPRERGALLDSAKDRSLDLVVLNAGAGDFGRFQDAMWIDIERSLRLNIDSVTHLAHELIPAMIANAKEKNSRAGLVFVSSHAFFMRVPSFSVYASAKAFLTHLGLTLAQELKSSPIDVLVTCPGATRTKFSSRAGLPGKMLSPPMEPDKVAAISLSALGKTSLKIVAPFDRILYGLSRILPVFIFDRLVARSQARLLEASSGSQPNDEKRKKMAV